MNDIYNRRNTIFCVERESDKYPEKIARAYGVSIFITVTGTVLGLFITTMAAYVISRKDFKYRNVISFFFYFTTLFNG